MSTREHHFFAVPTSPVIERFCDFLKHQWKSHKKWILMMFFISFVSQLENYLKVRPSDQNTPLSAEVLYLNQQIVPCHLYYRSSLCLLHLLMPSEQLLNASLNKHFNSVNCTNTSNNLTKSYSAELAESKFLTVLFIELLGKSTFYDKI